MDYFLVELKVKLERMIREKSLNYFKALIYRKEAASPFGSEKPL